MNVTKPIATVVLAIGLPIAGSAAELHPDTLKAWDQFVRDNDRQVQEHVAGKKPFLWGDESPERAACLRRGEIIVAPVIGHGTLSVPNGLIHHWIGAVFIPDATPTSLLNVVNNFDRYKEIYRPLVVESATIACTEQEQEYSMVWRHRVLMVDAAMQGRYKVHFHRLGPQRAYAITESDGIHEIQGFGTHEQRLLAPDTGSGFLWRIRSISRYEERDGGLYLEIEVMALTRDIPASMRWLVSPLINHLSINSLKTTLRQTRDAVRSLGTAGNPSCAAPQTDGVNVTSSNRGGVPSGARAWR